MDFSEEQIRTASRVFDRLAFHPLEGLTRAKDWDLFAASNDPEISAIVNVMAEEMAGGCVIVKSNTAMYMMPKPGNGLFGFSRSALRLRLVNSATADVNSYANFYMAVFAIIIYVSLFYNTATEPVMRQREYVEIRDFAKEMDKAFSLVEKDESRRGFSPLGETCDLPLNMADIADVWRSKKDQPSSNLKRDVIGSKIGFLNLYVLPFMRDQQLATYPPLGKGNYGVDDFRIYPTARLDVLITEYALLRDSQRKFSEFYGRILAEDVERRAAADKSREGGEDEWLQVQVDETAAAASDDDDNSQDTPF